MNITVARVQRNPTVKSEIQMRNFEASILLDSSAIRSARLQTSLHSALLFQLAKISFNARAVQEIVHKFNTVYGETLTEPEIILPSIKHAYVCQVLTEK